ncbi:MAG: filamentous hemagglutinin N-terminal domain-containing protein [Synechococcales bacterium]|nr:filamentous hemagglutinin N-terminal domain-containing protein [Synechococcales bacterium]
MKQLLTAGLISLGIAGMSSTFSRHSIAWAQVAPDASLGVETSVVENIRPNQFQIRGGAQRGSNLFHSFREFGVPTNGSVYFIDTPAVERIIARVTGDRASEIFGTLGVTGAADLFLLNPRGIVFGPNARLDVNGSFLATTADAFEFEGQGQFSATNPAAPPLLTIHPSALIFLQTAIAPIQNQSVQPVGFDRSGLRRVFGLQVPDGESLAVVGGDVILDGGQVNALDGHLLLGGLRGPGAIALTPTASSPRLVMPAGSPRADVVLRNNALMFVAATGTGVIQIAADSIVLEDSTLLAGLAPFQQRSPATIGTVTLDATGDILLRNSSIQNEGTIGSFGSGGDILIQGQNVQLLDGSIIRAANFQAGQAGQITILAAADIVLAGQQDAAPTLVFNISNPDGASLPTPEQGRVGMVLAGRSLTLADGAVIRSSAGAAGQAPDIQITTAEFVTLADEASIQTNPLFLQGLAGNINIDTGQLQLQGGASILASTASNGEGGNINITADKVTLSGISSSGLSFTQISSSAGGLGLGSSGNAGNIIITADQLRVWNGASISVSTVDDGQAGNIRINADLLEVAGESQSSRTLTFRSTIASSAIGFGLPTGDAGSIILDVNTLRLREGGLISVSTSSTGQAGTLDITADTIDITGTSSLVSETLAEGNGGNIFLTTQHLNLQDGGTISSSSTSTGNGGNIVIASVTSDIDDGRILAITTSPRAEAGNAGTIQVQARDAILLQGNSFITVETTGAGDARDLTLTTEDLQILDGAIVSAQSGLDATGNAGGINVNVASLNLSNQASVTARSFGTSAAGSLVVEADQIRLSNQANMTAETEEGSGGNIVFRGVRILDLQSNSAISASTENGEAGRIVVNQNQRPINLLRLDSSRIETAASGVGNAGGIAINGRSLVMNDGASISASTQSGRGGDIRLEGFTTARLDESAIAASTESGEAGQLRLLASDSVRLTNGSSLSVAAGGDRRLETPETQQIVMNEGSVAVPTPIAGSLILQTNELLVEDGSNITVSSPLGQAGNIEISANRIFLDAGEIAAETGANAPSGEESANVRLSGLELLFLEGESLISAKANAAANGGNIAINAEDGFIITNLTENSDIIATAEAGNGGNISISALRILGMQESTETRTVRNNTTNDISASSQFGTDGIIAIDEPGLDPVQRVAELPTATANPEVDQGCSRGGGRRASQFVDIRRGGVPPNPYEPLTSGGLWEDVQLSSHPLEHEAGDTAPGAAVVEAVGWLVNEQGQVVLLANAQAVGSQWDCSL